MVGHAKVSFLWILRNGLGIRSSGRQRLELGSGCAGLRAGLRTGGGTVGGKSMAQYALGPKVR